MGKRKEQFFNAKTFAVYYKDGKEDILSKYDIVIVEPRAHNTEDIKRIKMSGTLALAYVSILEVHALSPGYNLLRDEDYCYVEGKKLKNNIFGTSIVKLYSKRWYAILIHHIGNLLLNEGYDGVFFDTVGDLECYNLPKDIYELMCKSLLKFMIEIRQLFIDFIIIQNNGIEKIYNITAPYIDGICWENPLLKEYSSIKFVESYLCSIKQKTNLKILIIFSKENKYMKRVIEKNSFLFYEGTEDYVEIIKY
jgi:endo-alpha-1,4-polygalactosaminidase (GH114 family)